MRLPRIQFSLFGLLAALAVFGVVLGCIVKFGLSLAMVTLLWGLLLVALTVTPVLAFVGKPERRGFHAGFAWFGWMYVLVCFFGTLADSPNAGMPTSALAYPRLAIEKWMFATYTWVVPPASRTWQSDPASDYQSLAMEYDSRVVTPGGFGGGGFGGGGGMGPVPMGVGGGGFGTAPAAGFFGGAMPAPPVAAAPKPIRIIPWAVCRDIGHAVLASLWALLGGCFAVLIARRNARRAPESATPIP